MSTPTPEAPVIDRDLALRLAGERLDTEFPGLGRETIDSFLETSYEQFAAGARIPTFLPLMAERFSRQRLRALARVERERAKPTVLFLDPDNAGRSLLALGLFETLSCDGAVGWSGGAQPALDIDPGVTDAMRERGIDLGDEFPKPWTDEIIQAADVVVIMGDVAVPELAGQRYEHWDVPETAGRDLDAVRAVRDDLEEKVRDLLNQLDVGVSG